MSFSTILRDPNKIIDQHERVLWSLNNPVSLAILQLLRAERRVGFGHLAARLSTSADLLRVTLRLLERAGLITTDAGEYTLPPHILQSFERHLLTASSLLGTTVIGAAPSETAHPLEGRYKVVEEIGRGATSITFRAVQATTHRNRTLKVFYPHTVTMSDLDSALSQRSTLNNKCLPEIVDAGEISLELMNSSTVTVPCVVLSHVEASAETLDAYLAAHDNIDQVFLERFVEDVGTTLCDIQNAGLEHGDLHESNILVESTTPLAGLEGQAGSHFWVIDFVGVPSGGSIEVDAPSDIDSFRRHLLRAILLACERAPGVSARLLLGERVYRVLQILRRKKELSFRSLMTAYVTDKGEIPDDYFQRPTPRPFEWLRVEFIRNASWLFRLFEPMESWHKEIAKFGNICISGPRGCGKSHYLRVLAFHPTAIARASTDAELREKLNQLQYDFRRLFGVLFTCRLGEFKAFTPEAIGDDAFDADTELFLKHILVLKILNKTLCAIIEGMTIPLPGTEQRYVLDRPPGAALTPLASFVSVRLGKIAGFQAEAGTTLLRQIAAVCMARENSAVSVWHRRTERGQARRLNEMDLHEFFAVLRRCFPDLRHAQFAVLVDDATAGHMSFGYQKILNSLIRAAHGNHCFKLTHEKYRYTLESTDGRPVDPRNELAFVDLGESSLRAQKRHRKTDVANYLSRVVNRRLAAGKYVADIAKVLGRSQDVRTFLSRLAPGASRKQRARANAEFEISIDEKEGRALYAGWNIVWQLSHGSVRTLLEIIEEIYRDANVSEHDNQVSLEEQDFSVRNYSVRRFKTLGIEPGEIRGRPLGEAMQDVLAAIGEISWRYITSYETGTQQRWYETISVDRNERGPLDEEAMTVLEALLKNDLLLAEGVNYSRSQVGLGVRYDLNKVFSPAFRTTYRVRNHLYVSNAVFEELLRRPGVFVRRHARKLKDLVTEPRRNDSGQGDLFHG